jgi:hypothetical protein
MHPSKYLQVRSVKRERKAVGRTYGVLQACFAKVKVLARFWNKENLDGT